jgi:hypothetical protein
MQPNPIADTSMACEPVPSLRLEYGCEWLSEDAGLFALNSDGNKKADPARAPAFIKFLLLVLSIINAFS